MPDPQQVQVGVHAPYEDAIIEGFKLFEKIIDGQSPDVKHQLWQGWIDFWKIFGIGR